MKLTELIEKLDFEEFDYFYHETSKDKSDLILQEGLLVKGTNILDTSNIIFTTTLPITKNMVQDEASFYNFLDLEKTSSSIRDVSEMVIIGAPKDYEKRIVSPYNKYKDGIYYEGIINNNFILGYIDMFDKQFKVNMNYEYSDELLSDRSYYL